MREDLSLYEQLKIAETLEACDCISNRESRETVLSYLDKACRGIVKEIHRKSDTKTDVMEILSTCLEYSGSLEQLVEIIAFTDKETHKSVKDLRALIEKIRAFEVVNLQLFDELTEITINLNVAKKDLLKIRSRSLLPNR